MYTIQLNKCTPKQCVVLRESTKYAVYNVRCIYPVIGFKNVDFICIYFIFGGGGLLKLSGGGGVKTLTDVFVSIQTGVFMRTFSALYFRSVKRCTQTV